MNVRAGAFEEASPLGTLVRSRPGHWLCVDSDLEESLHFIYLNVEGWRSISCTGSHGRH